MVHASGNPTWQDESVSTDTPINAESLENIDLLLDALSTGGAGSLSRSANLSDLANVLTARSNLGAAGRLLTPNVQSANYTLALTDAVDTLVAVSSSSSRTLTVPKSTTVAFQLGTIIPIARLGSGAVAVAGATGVTVNNPSSANLRASYSTASLWLYAADTWLLSGDLA